MLFLLFLPSSRDLTKNKTWMSSSPSSTEVDLSPPQVIPIALAFSPDKPFVEIEEDITKKGKTTEVILAKKVSWVLSAVSKYKPCITVKKLVLQLLLVLKRI